MANQRETECYQNSILDPIYQNIAFFYEDTETVVESLHRKKVSRGRYGRYHNPLWEKVEKRLANLEGAEQGVLFSSGMSAIYHSLMALFEKGSFILAPVQCYKNTKIIFQDLLSKFGVESEFVSLEDPDLFLEKVYNCREHLDAIFLEIPSNPHLYFADLEKIRSIIKKDTLIITDTTLATPINFNPIEWGADIVIHSCTKYMGGQGDLMMGCVLGKNGPLDTIRTHRNITGAVPSSHDTFLLNRSINTLSLRMEYLNNAGVQLADYLKKHPKVKKVYYPSLEEHPHRHLYDKYVKGYGGLVTFDIDADKEKVSEFVDLLEHPYMASNFGSPQTLIEHLSVFTYYNLTPEERREIHITDGMIRLAIGYTVPIASIINDIDKALDKI
ncbi:MAG: Cys/Met metabolism pyridoxal-phosphate-dependent protein [Candidatus Electrothrix sp. AW5]|nr:Cys/Met metabolism pyridoxal-phosphate-dependent protein [Candidatus Electrothrix gigas]